jgi:hypothetical protein
VSAQRNSVRRLTEIRWALNGFPSGWAWIEENRVRRPVVHQSSVILDGINALKQRIGDCRVELA